MKKAMIRFQFARLLAVCLLLSGCGDSSDGSDSASSNTSTSNTNTSNTSTSNGGATGNTSSNGETGGGCADTVGEGLQSGQFYEDGLASPIEEVACTLSDGSASVCYRIQLAGAPANHETGPYCPRTIDDTGEDAGIWLEGGEVYDVDGDFIVGLAEFYNDDNWQLYNPDTGEVNVTTTRESCEAAARPNVDPEYQNHCVECLIDYVDGGVEFELLIPKTPVEAARTSDVGMNTVGVALNGVRFDPPAPVDAILGAYTIAAFDDCGGHVNLVNGYHYHAATGCSEAMRAQCDGHAPLIGYALDGYAIHAMANDDGVEPSDLDACRGHSDDVRGYHYHAASAGENMFIGCFHGLTAQTTTDTGMGGMDMNSPPSCDDVPDGMLCCGDGTCGGPETADNCPEDCQ